jgi:hypothetical protein
MWHTINGMMKTLNPNPNPNSCCVAMWHTINGMMKTLNPNPNPNTCKVKPCDLHGDSNSQNTSCICNYIVWSLGCHMACS